MGHKSSSHADRAPILDIRRVGDGRALSRTLARIIVRRELISAGAIPDPDRCDDPPLAG